MKMEQIQYVIRYRRVEIFEGNTHAEGRKSSAARSMANVMALQGLDGRSEERPKPPRN